jgi:hypothetical protein
MMDVAVPTRPSGWARQRRTETSGPCGTYSSALTWHRQSPSKRNLDPTQGRFQGPWVWQLPAAKLAMKIAIVRNLGGLWKSVSKMGPKSRQQFQGHHSSGGGRTLDRNSLERLEQLACSAPDPSTQRGHMRTMRGFVFNSHAQMPSMEWSAPMKIALGIALRVCSLQFGGTHGDATAATKAGPRSRAAAVIFLRRAAGNENGRSVFSSIAYDAR